MSTLNGGPGNIVTNGLVFYVDAANPTSYISGSLVWNDLISSGYSGSLINNVGYSTSSLGTLTFFTGSGSFVRITQNANFNPISQDSQSFSISCWVKGAITSSENVVIGQDWGNTGNGWNALRLRPEVIMFQIGNNSAATIAVDYFNLLSPTVFKHYTGVYNGTQVILYTNGIAVNTVSTALHPNLNNLTKSWTVAGNYQRISPSNASFLQGEIPIVQFYNRALSADEILQNYNAQKSRFGL